MVMLRKPRWKSIIRTFEMMQDTLDDLIHEEVFTHLLCFEEKLRQNGKLILKLKVIALQALKFSLRYHSSKTPSNSSSVNEQIITKIFGRMLNLEKDHNKERDEEGMAHVCFTYHKEGHTIHDCSLVLPHKKIYAMLAVSNRIERKSKERNLLNLSLIAEIKESSIIVDVDKIIASQNIIDLGHWRSYITLSYQRI
jgi:hypothetical protein